MVEVVTSDLLWCTRNNRLSVGEELNAITIVILVYLCRDSVFDRNVFFHRNASGQTLRTGDVYKKKDQDCSPRETFLIHNIFNVKGPPDWRYPIRCVALLAFMLCNSPYW